MDSTPVTSSASISQAAPPATQALDEDSRRSGADRREDNDRRRNARGLLEKRARREFSNVERRQQDRRDSPWSWRSLWRRG